VPPAGKTLGDAGPIGLTERLYSNRRCESSFSALLHLIRTARAEAVCMAVDGNLKEKRSVEHDSPDPLKANISGRLASFELRLARLKRLPTDSDGASTIPLI